MLCKICNRDEQILKAVVDGVKHVQCTCGVTFVDPMPLKDEVGKIYENDYVEGMGLNEDNPHFKEEYQPIYQSEKAMTFKDLCFPYEKGENKKWLDVGCANGLFVGWIERFGYDAVGVDVSNEMIKIARSKGLNCYCKDPSELDDLYDVISMWDVIEHLLDPIDLVVKVSKRLKRGGSLLLQTPCTGIISDTFGNNWREYTYPNHLHFFSQEALFNVLTCHGFSVNSWVRFGSGNNSGTLPDDRKKVFDTIAKQLGIGDIIAMWAKKNE